MTQKPELTNRKSIYDGQIINVKVDTLSLPNGHKVERELVQKSNAVVMVPIDNNDNVLLVRQWRQPADQALLEAPAGTIDGDESADDCAQRELQEEIGYTADHLEHLASFWVAPGWATEYMHAYLATGLRASKLQGDEDENIEVVRLPFDEAVAMFKTGEINAGKTIAALLLAQSLLTKR